MLYKLQIHDIMRSFSDIYMWHAANYHRKIIWIIPPFLKKHVKELFLITVAIMSRLFYLGQKEKHTWHLRNHEIWNVFFQCMLHIFFLFHQLCNTVQCPDRFNRNYTIYTALFSDPVTFQFSCFQLCFNYKHVELEGSSEQRIGLNQSPVTRLQLSPCPEHCGRTMCGHPGVSKGPV